ncbi:MAG: DNA gyrase C-terminal beta-propeller domain-containing protein [Acidimicrobiales bacterium]
MTSAQGQTIRFSEEAVRPMGRTAAGVRGLKLREGDRVVGCDVVREERFLLVMSERGYGKRTEPHHFGRKGRGGLGMRSMKVNDERGDVVGALMVDEGDDIFVINSSGVVIRTRVAEVSVQGRDATGVRIMNLEEGEVVAAIAPAPASEDDVDEADAAEATVETESDVTAGPDSDEQD